MGDTLTLDRLVIQLMLWFGLAGSVLTPSQMAQAIDAIHTLQGIAHTLPRRKVVGE